MNVLRASVLGFCMGVRRAVEMADTALSSEESPSICTLGPLIHNPQVLESLAKRGVHILEELDQCNRNPVTGQKKTLSDTAIIIRAHGVSPDTEQLLREQGARIIDATCPRVKASQNTALALAEKGYLIFLAGEKDHAEIKGIYGYAMKGASQFADKSHSTNTGKQPRNFPCRIVGNSEEADRAACELKKTSDQRHNGNLAVLISQTTISGSEYGSIAEAIKKHFPDLEVKDTICKATRDRQDALQNLCSVVDAVVIAGGKESANTRRLLSIAKDCDKPAWLAETAGDLLPEIKTFKTIGLSAGASTPDNVIDEIEHALL